MLDILTSYCQDEREELLEGYHSFLLEISDILINLDRVVEGLTYWGWKFDWGHHPWQLKTRFDLTSGLGG